MCELACTMLFIGLRTVAVVSPVKVWHKSTHMPVAQARQMLLAGRGRGIFWTKQTGFANQQLGLTEQSQRVSMLSLVSISIACVILIIAYQIFSFLIQTALGKLEQPGCDLLSWLTLDLSFHRRHVFHRCSLFKNFYSKYFQHALCHTLGEKSLNVKQISESNTLLLGSKYSDYSTLDTVASYLLILHSMQLVFEMLFCLFVWFCCCLSYNANNSSKVLYIGNVFHCHLLIFGPLFHYW